MEKNPDPEKTSRIRHTVFPKAWIRCLLDPGSGIRDGKIRLRDKHPESVTLYGKQPLSKTTRVLSGFLLRTQQEMPAYQYWSL
jgi:hypothetical protein